MSEPVKRYEAAIWEGVWTDGKRHSVVLATDFEAERQRRVDAEAALNRANDATTREEERAVKAEAECARLREELKEAVDDFESLIPCIGDTADETFNKRTRHRAAKRLAEYRAALEGRKP